jgi:hypothetical protein
MGLGRNQLSISIEQSDRFQMLSALTVCLDDVVQVNRHTEIQADIVVVKGRVVTNGFDVSIACRVLEFQDRSLIDTAGRNGDLTFEPGLKPVSPATPGAAGIDGHDSSPGHRGGNVKIITQKIIGVPTIIANGGNAGRPQDGGDGINGANGKDGKHIKERLGKGNPHGENGSNGGGRGLPGQRQSGGNGGNITIHGPVNSFHNATLVGSPGASSLPANPGTEGKGGSGGKAGSYGEYKQYTDCFTLAANLASPAADLGIYYAAQIYSKLASGEAKLDSPILADEVSMQPLHSDCKHGWELVRTISGSAGIPGNNGDLRETELAIKNADPNPALAGSINVFELNQIIIGKSFSDLVLELITCFVEDQYRNSGNTPNQELIEQIQFLYLVADTDEFTSNSKREILARVFAMVRKISLGLDFYGYTMQHAPLLSFDTYSNLINQLVIPQANIVEQSFQQYWDAASNAETKRASLVLAKDGAQKRNAALAYAYDTAKEELHRQLLELPALDGRVDSAYNLLMDAKNELDKALKKNHKCDLVSTLTTVSVIVAAVYTGGAALVTAASASKKLYNDLSQEDSTLWDDRKVIADDLKEIAKDAKTVDEAVKKINDGFSKLNQEQKKLPQFKMEREQFDKVAKDFAEIPEAAKYKEAGYDYLKCVETRNQAIVDYNAGLVRFIEFKTQLNSDQRIVDDIQSALNSSVDPSSPYLVSLMNRLYLDTLALAAQYVYAEQKALAYHFARPIQAPVSGLNLSTIIAAHQRTVLVDWAGAKERWASNKRLVKDGELTLHLQKLVTQEAWEAFKNSGVLGFTIRFDHPFYNPIFEYLSGVRLTGIDLIIAGAELAVGQEYIPSRLTHQGSEAIYLADGSVNYFSHRAVTFTGFSHVSGTRSGILSPDFSENGLYTGVSPFAAWTLHLSNNPNLKLSLKKLKSVELKLTGFILGG